MKILPVSLYNKSNIYNNSRENKLSKDNNTSKYADYRPLYYNDYNITFSGRTPENFYAQEFNRNNMPKTMKDYLDYDYETRQKIPPEQMMREVFKYIEIADNFDEVKSIYPNEDLFKDLHENKINSRKGVLAEIATVKSLSDTPLFKDGSDDFGMYLLKKIYLEGKTIKEISKDFLENDINDEYKGIVTEPITYSSLDAYGISYPKNAFWHSFINTRDEYKKFFVTLPKDNTIPGVKSASAGKSEKADESNGSDNTPQKPKRKYTIKKHQKDQIRKDIIDKKDGDIDSVKKAVVKRFGKNDPEASFIVKYMSPIMTVASHRAHMSEELKNFAECEQLYGKQTDEKTMLKRFWKQNPQMLEVFSYAITDTIDMFEDIYGAGGNIPINSDLDVVMQKSDKQKIIDYVSPEFLELLDYSKSIQPLREENYALHDALQKEWEKHFIDKYGSLESVEQNGTLETNEITSDSGVEQTPLDILKAAAAKNNCEVYTLKLANGSTFYLTANLDEVLRDEIKNVSRYLPSKYTAMILKDLKNNSGISDKFKLTLAANKLNQEFDDEQLMSNDEFDDEYLKILCKLHHANWGSKNAALMAVYDAMKDVLPLENHYSLGATDYQILARLNKDDTIDKIFSSNKDKIDSKYDEYKRPLSESEINKIQLALLSTLANYNPDESVFTNRDSDSVTLLSMLRDVMKYKSKKYSFRKYMNIAVPRYTYSRCILNKNDSQEVKQAKMEYILRDLTASLLYAAEEVPYLIAVYNKETYDKYKQKLSAETQQDFDTAIAKLDNSARMQFLLTNAELEKINKQM